MAKAKDAAQEDVRNEVDNLPAEDSILQKRSIYQRLQEARVIVLGSDMKKTGHNAHMKFKYFELGDFLPIIQKAMLHVGMTGFISYEDDHSTLTLVNCDNSDDRIVIRTPNAPAEMKGVQAVQLLGAMQTYLRRYLWVTAFEIAEGDAVDQNTGDPQLQVPEDKPMPFVTKMRAATTIQQLKDEARAAREAMQTKAGRDVITGAYYEIEKMLEAVAKAEAEEAYRDGGKE